MIEVVVAQGLASSTEVAAKGRVQGFPVEDVLGPGRYVIRLNGESLEVSGPEGLQKGDRVRVVGERRAEASGTQEWAEAATLQEAILLPLAFGGPKAALRVEVSVPKGKKKPGKPIAVFFLVETDTTYVGKTQWGIHLRGRRLALQLYQETPTGELPDPGWAQALVDRFIAMGFEMEHPLLRVKKPLRAPEGYGVSVRG